MLEFFSMPSLDRQIWLQTYDPLGNAALSTACAALPLILLLSTLAFLRVKAHWAALSGLTAAFVAATAIFGMPLSKVLQSAAYGAAFGLLPIGWIILNVIFLYSLTEETGLFAVLRDSLRNVTADRRLQLILIAFSFGAFFVGAAGFGTPVAVTAALLVGLGFTPLSASGLSLLANTAPVAFGALGTPIIALKGVTGIDIHSLSAMVGRQLPFFSLLVPFWLVWAYAGLKGMLQIWPAALVAGACFAIPQFLISNFHGPWLVDVIASICSISGLTLFLYKWQPKQIWQGGDQGAPKQCASSSRSRTTLASAWMPWFVLSMIVFLWGLPWMQRQLDCVFCLELPLPGLHLEVLRAPPIVPMPRPEAAVFRLNLLSTTGTGIFLAAVLAGLLMRLAPSRIARIYWSTLKRVRLSLLTVMTMLALGFVTRYSGLDAALGLAFAKAGVFYPFCGAILGWLGVALTGSDTSSNVLFGSLQKISAEQVGVSATLMAAANSSGGVMGKMIDAQSIVVASTATKWYGHEGLILRYVFFHSLALAVLVGMLVSLQAYFWPFTLLVVR